MLAGARSIYTRRWESHEKRKKIQKKNFFKDLLSYTLIQWFHRYFIHNEIIKMGWLFHCYTGSFRKHKLHLHSYVLSSDNYIIVKLCSNNITGLATPFYIKNELRSSHGTSFIRLPFVFQQRTKKSWRSVLSRTRTLH